MEEESATEYQNAEHALACAPPNQTHVTIRKLDTGWYVEAWGNGKFEGVATTRTKALRVAKAAIEATLPEEEPRPS